MSALQYYYHLAYSASSMPPSSTYVEKVNEKLVNFIFDNYYYIHYLVELTLDC